MLVFLMYSQCGIFVSFLGLLVYFSSKVNKVVVAITALPYVFMIPFCGLFELVLFLYRHELTAIAKWAFLTQQQRHNYVQPNHLVASIISEIRKIFSGNLNTVEWLYLLEMTLILLYLVCGPILPILFATFGYDPVCIFVSLLQPSQSVMLLVKAVRAIMLIATLQTVLYAMRTLVVLGLGLAQTALTIPNLLLRMHYTTAQIRLYNQTRVAVSILYPPAKAITGGLLGVLYFGLMVTITISLQGFKYLPFNVYIHFPALSVMGIYGLLAMFYACCKMYDITGRVLERNREHLALMLNAKLARKILKSLRPIAVPLADIGMMDHDVRLNYFSRLVCEETDMLILTEDLFDN